MRARVRGRERHHAPLVAIEKVRRERERARARARARERETERQTERERETACTTYSHSGGVHLRRRAAAGQKNSEKSENIILKSQRI